MARKRYRQPRFSLAEMPSCLVRSVNASRSRMSAVFPLLERFYSFFRSHSLHFLKPAGRLQSLAQTNPLEGHSISRRSSHIHALSPGRSGLLGLLSLVATPPVGFIPFFALPNAIQPEVVKECNPIFSCSRQKNAIL
ncbi:unnamed protein product [Protopolystoma xenopodis]|uniref:Uncharacterized protein n=1 Tax=Protopolystoma xenopodis TaxID=117903 RepID=A0A448WD77_9PLAT|nr:unnamed protein product [Protopolystoma xenopodis]